MSDELPVLKSSTNNAYFIRLFIRRVVVVLKDQEKRIKNLEQVKDKQDKHQALLNNCVDDDKAILHKREIKGKGDN